MACPSNSVHDNQIAPDSPQPSPSPSILPSQLQQSVPDILTGLCNSIAHHNLLSEWRADEKTLRFRMHRKEQNLSSAESEIYQLLGIFSLFQGVFFGALAQTNVFRCQDWLSPFCMSLIVFVATFLAVEQKIWAFAEIETELTRTRQEAAALYECIGKLMDEGSHYDLNRLNFEPRVRTLVEYSDSNLGMLTSRYPPIRLPFSKWKESNSERVSLPSESSCIP